MNSHKDLPAASVLYFGPYAFHLRQRLILDGDRPLRMGGRALDILQVLVEHAGREQSALVAVGDRGARGLGQLAVRAGQQVTWMWAQTEAAVLDALHGTRRMRSISLDLESSVRSGRVSALDASGVLLREFAEQVPEMGWTALEKPSD